ncbi:hypothetical protein D3C78_1415240 [compost metagenome]
MPSFDFMPLQHAVGVPGHDIWPRPTTTQLVAIQLVLPWDPEVNDLGIELKVQQPVCQFLVTFKDEVRPQLVAVD